MAVLLIWPPQKSVFSFSFQFSVFGFKLLIEAIQLESENYFFSGTCVATVRFLSPKYFRATRFTSSFITYGKKSEAD
jgi:hypothetical protein